MTQADPQTTLQNNPQITSLTITCHPKTEDLFWRSVICTLGAICSIAFTVSVALILGKLL